MRFPFRLRYRRLAFLMSRLLARTLSTLRSAPAPTLETLLPGLAVVRSSLSEHAQTRLAEHACALGRRPAPEGFLSADGRPNSRPYRSRIFSAVSAWPDPEFVQGVCEDAVHVARSGAADGTGRGTAGDLPAMTPTHVLLLAYMNDEGVGWHRDIYENDGQADHPIVTINLGNACDFVFKDDHSEPKTSLTLHSGDALLFGGPRRHAMHKVSRVHEGTCPEFLLPTLAGVLERARREHPSKKERENDDEEKDNVEEEEEPPFGETVRLSLTFRDAPAVLGREHEFATFKVEEHFDKDENFAWKGGALIGTQQGQEKEPEGGSKGQGRRDGGS